MTPVSGSRYALSMGRSPRFALAPVLGLVLLGLLLPHAAEAKKEKLKMTWHDKSKVPALKACEPPAIFYSSHHKTGRPPCCALMPGMCPGGVACPASGTCPNEAVACSPTAPVNRPNVVLYIGDDLGYCARGAAGECRSPISGTPVPAPSTPNLDVLGAYGTVFPVTHNTSSWCFPSLASMLTGRYQRNFNGSKQAATDYGSIPASLRSLNGTGQIDPFNADDRIGGYCTLLAGKLTGSLGNHGFDARTKESGRKLGRTECVEGPGGTPECASAQTPATYEPTAIYRMGNLFEFMNLMLYRQPGPGPVTYRSQPFFTWYAPRIPHQPLRAPFPIDKYLFGSETQFPFGGLFNQGAMCSGTDCPPSVPAMYEINFGNVYEYYDMVWLMDDNLREIRKFLQRESQPHCINAQGRSDFTKTQANCDGEWAEVIATDLERNTVIIFIADNGWHVPASKHRYTENGYRVFMTVFDPRNLPSIPHWDPDLAGALPTEQRSTAIAHSLDLHPTIVGYALGTAGEQLCPKAADGTRCDGRDLRAHLKTAPGGPAAPETLRKSLCAHETNKVSSPSIQRYLLSGPNSVGRCTNLAAASCTTSAQCGGSAFCLGGHCMPKAEPACSKDADCPAGSLCLGRQCRVGPSCMENSDCASMFPGGSYACVQRETKWCRNAPDVACSTIADCPVCPTWPGASSPYPCNRTCEPRQLKFYAIPGGAADSVELSDIFLDPDEKGLHGKFPGTVVEDMSSMLGPYGDMMRRANCCLDDWWPAVAELGTQCSPGYSCPSSMTCYQPPA